MAKAKAKPSTKATKTAAKPSKPVVKAAPKPKPAIELDKEVAKGKWKLKAAELLPLVEGFESEVAQLKHLEQKFNNPSKNPKVLVKQYNSQKAIVNGILSKLNVEV